MEKSPRRTVSQESVRSLRKPQPGLCPQRVLVVQTVQSVDRLRNSSNNRFHLWLVLNVKILVSSSDL